MNLSSAGLMFPRGTSYSLDKKDIPTEQFHPCCWDLTNFTCSEPVFMLISELRIFAIHEQEICNSHIHGLFKLGVGASWG